MPATKTESGVLCCVCAAIMKMKKGPLRGKVFTDEDWNDENNLEDGPYQYSKVGHHRSKWPQHLLNKIGVQPRFILLL